jgi:hypothetical protein
MLRIFLSGLSKRRIQPERYVPFFGHLRNRDIAIQYEIPQEKNAHDKARRHPWRRF